MKQIITLGFVLASAACVQAQGTIEVYSTASATSVYTNTALSTYDGGTGLGGTSSKAALTPSGVTTPYYYYALLAESYSSTLTGTPSINQLAAMTPVITGITNYGLAGGLGGPGHAVGFSTPNGTWGAPVNSYTDGTEDSYVLVGWSSNEGTSWSTVLSELQNESWPVAGSFGDTVFGYGYSGGGLNGLPAPSIFGVTTAEPGGLSAGPTLYTVVPEPTTLALSALGGLSLLAFRRKKA